MKPAIAILSSLASIASLAALSSTRPAAAMTATQREYRRGYWDCAKGRYDQEQHGESYKRGCRAAEARRGPAPPTAPGDPLAEDSKACLAAVKEQTHNPVAAVLGADSSEANTSLTIGVGPDHAPWRCLVKDGVVAEVMSLADEGAL